MSKTIQIQTTAGNRPAVVREIQATECPKTKDGDPYTYERFGRHTRSKASTFLNTWQLPKKVKELQGKLESELADAMPDQRRRMVRNVKRGRLMRRYLTRVAMNEDLPDRACQRWSRSARDTIRVAICLDGTCYSYHSPSLLASRMALAIGLAGALDGLDYQVSVRAATLSSPGTGRNPGSPDVRLNPKSYVFSTQMKSETEPVYDSMVAHLADTDLRRMMIVWMDGANSRATQLTDVEWRQLTDDPDLMVYIGEDETKLPGGLPAGAPIGPIGDDVIRLRVANEYDIPGATKQLVRFFNDRAE